MTKVLITGASGFIGRNLAEQLACDYNVTAPSRADLDLCDAEFARHFYPGIAPLKLDYVTETFHSLPLSFATGETTTARAK